jgi:hypothetical protein
VDRNDSFEDFLANAPFERGMAAFLAQLDKVSPLECAKGQLTKDASKLKHGNARFLP